VSTAYFDNSAASYDTEFTTSAIGVLQRKRVYHYLVPLVKKTTRVLEVNCGTGHDAIQLAPLAGSYYATDVSQQMVRVCEEKLKQQPIDNLRFAVMDINHLVLPTEQRFDLLVSNFGGLNCLNPEQLKSFSNSIGHAMNSGAKLVLVIMPKKCWMENAWYRLRKDKRLYRRNTDKGVPTEVNGRQFYTYYYSPTDVAAIFSEGFVVKTVKSIGLFIPPSYLNPLFEKRLWLLKILNAAEWLFGGFAFFANYADHVYMELEKKK